MSDLTRDDYQRDLQALRGNVIYAWEAMKIAGFSIADDATPLDMVTHLLKRNQDQKTLEDGLQERVKAAEGANHHDIQGCYKCPFTVTRDQRGDVIACKILDRELGFFPSILHPARAVEDCPAIDGILVKKAEDASGDESCEVALTEGGARYAVRSYDPSDRKEGNSGSAADGAGRPPQQPVAGGDRSNDPESPR
jgi:hypothetical protein